jgi:hypothetical protein
MELKSERFTSDGSWDSMLANVAEFCKSLRREQIINISVSEFGQYMSTGTIIVWYTD